MILRILESLIKLRIDHRKAIIILGPRQVGKTTLIQNITAPLKIKVLSINGDDPATRSLWNNPTKSFILQYLGDHKTVIIDEAQRLTNIGLSAKMILDNQSGIQLFISGSSSLEIASTINEPLTGRKWEFRLYPLSWAEVSNHFSFADTIHRLENFLITGMYPEVISYPNDAKEILRNLASSFLYKDILEMSGIRKPDLLWKLLQSLAWQVGNEVSYNELAKTIGADKNTVLSYIDLLEKSFVIFRLNPFSRNLRNEINSTRKIYFYDNGVLNTIINNYAPIAERNDIGALWENFLISERKKKLAYSEFYGNMFFWRTKNQIEIDYLEESNGKISCFEMKWNPKSKVSFPETFIRAYHPIETKVIHRENFWEWLK